jgi:serine/threonine protein kinase/Tol biopolymer transport system component
MITPGARFGAYEVVEPLDSGGMGEVYRARDSRLRRDVAIKVLSDRHRFDPERRARFEREAVALAAVNHPNIATIHGIEDADGIQAIVMELVEGRALAEHVMAGLRVSEALKYAAQIVDALEAAHERGIVHRDLKPSNIKVQPDRSIKVLDFGLAKAVDPAGTSVDMPTATVTAADTAAVIGTPCYMSPEQARGQTVDRRTDIWAFGCVLYEMLSGRRAFDGPTTTDVIAGVLEREPDYGALPPATPPLVRRLLKRCLDKDLKRRLRDIADARVDLEEARGTFATPDVATDRPKTSRVRRTALIATAAIALLVAGGFTARWLWAPSAPASSRQFVLLPPDGSNFGAGPADRTPPFALSPDGTRLAFVATTSSRSGIWIRSLDSLEALLVAGTEGVGRFCPPAWSPDGTSIAFAADGKLKRVSVQGGSPITLADASNAQGISWSRAGWIVFAPSPNDTLLRIPDTGGTPVPATRLSTGDLGHVAPQFLPDGRHFVYLVRAPRPRKGIYVGSIDSLEERFVRPSREKALYAPPGHLLLLEEGRLLAQKFDTDSFAVSGEPIPLTESVAYINTDGRASVDVSPGGTLAYRVNGISTASQPVWVDRAGKTIGTVGPPGDYSSASLSPDRTRLAIELHDLKTSTGDLWIWDIDRQSMDPYTTDRMHNTNAVWSSNGKEIVFVGRPDGGRNLHLKPLDGSTSDEPLLTLGIDRVPTSWSRDGKVILFEEGPVNDQGDLWTLRLPERTPTQFLATEFNERGGRFSPDGRWVSYVTNRSGRNEVRVCRFPGCTDGVTISSNGGAGARWHPDGKELFFVAPNRDVYAVPVTIGESFSAGTPRRLFTAERFVENWFDTDGERFFIVPDPPGPAPTAPPITVVEDWTSLLRTSR